jgi:sugar O-acyltransferase (sialic acid O-acetyltransferase NeuD family)
VKSDLLVVLGSSGHSKVVVEAVRSRSPDRKIVIIDDSPDAGSRQVLGIAVSGGRELLSAQFKGAPVALAVGDNRARSLIMKWLASNGHAIETVVHPSAIVGDSVVVGAGAFIAAGAILIADSRIGPGVIVNTAASIDHDCEIEAAAHIAPGVHLCGNVRIGQRSLIGVGSSARPGVSIASDVIIGAGSVIVGDIAARGTYVGNPARQLQTP